jgi:hypothetical protein
VTHDELTSETTKPPAIFTRPKSAGDLNKDPSKPNASAIPATRSWPNCSPPLFFSGSVDRVYTGDCGVSLTLPCRGVPPLLGARWTMVLSDAIGGGAEVGAGDLGAACQAPLLSVGALVDHHRGCEWVGF